jgi:hypothetical protein
MNTDETRMGQMLHGETTSHFIGAALEVHNTLGYGFLEKVYQRTSRDACQFRARTCSIQKNDPMIPIRAHQAIPYEHEHALPRIDS